MPKYKLNRSTFIKLFSLVLATHSYSIQSVLAENTESHDAVNGLRFSGNDTYQIPANLSQADKKYIERKSNTPLIFQPQLKSKIKNFAAVASLNRGLIFAKNKKYAEAIEEYNTAIQNGMKDGIIYHYRSEAYEKIGNTPAAEKDRKKAEKLGYKINDAQKDGQNTQE